LVDSEQDDRPVEREEDEIEIEKAKRLPSVEDPKLWRVRVKKGFERLAAMALMNKQIDFAKQGMPFEIISATFIENLE
jgi:hypothetical protein